MYIHMYVHTHVHTTHTHTHLVTAWILARKLVHMLAEIGRGRVRGVHYGQAIVEHPALRERERMLHMLIGQGHGGAGRRGDRRRGPLRGLLGFERL